MTISEREMALSKVNNAIPVFSKINELYYRANTINQRAQANEADLEYTRRHNGSVKGLLISLVVGALIGDLLASIIRLIFKVNSAAANNIILDVFVIGGAVLSVLLSIMIMKNKKRYISEEQNIMDKRLASISDEICDITIKNDAVISQIPRDYRYYEAVEYFEKVLANGAAESMKEAIALYEESCHRRNIELNNSIIADQMRAQTQMMKYIEDNTGRTAYNSGIAATFSVLNYLR